MNISYFIKILHQNGVWFYFWFNLTWTFNNSTVWLEYFCTGIYLFAICVIYKHYHIDKPQCKYGLTWGKISSQGQT